VQRLTANDAVDIVMLFNETNNGQHYNGSGWMDFRLHLIHLFTMDKLNFGVDSATGQIVIDAS
jgi:hypothetical protein